MVIKDNYLHSTYSNPQSKVFGKKVAVRKIEVITYEEHPNGTALICLNAEEPVIIAMPYDEVKLELQEKVC